MPLSWSFTGHDDDDEFGTFSCWDGDPSAPWVAEVENYVRAWALRDAQYVLTFRDDEGTLVAVAAFDKRVISVPIVEPIDHPGWHLLVVAIRLQDQRKGLSRDVFGGIFEAMRAVDSDRVLYTAYVHIANRSSVEACARVELLPFVQKDEHYWILLGEVPGP